MPNICGGGSESGHPGTVPPRSTISRRHYKPSATPGELQTVNAAGAPPVNTA